MDPIKTAEDRVRARWLLDVLDDYLRECPDPNTVKPKSLINKPYRLLWLCRDILRNLSQRPEEVEQPSAAGVPESVDWRWMYRFQTAMRFMDSNASMTRERAFAMADDDVESLERAAAPNPAGGES